MVEHKLLSWSVSWRRTSLLAVAALVLLGAGWAGWFYADHTVVRLLTESPGSGRCKKEMTRAILDRSLELGTRFLLVHQRPEGNFDYEYDWRAGTYSSEDSDVRQAGALWGIALLFHQRPTAELRAALDRGFAFFEQHARDDQRNGRCIAYPGATEPGIGTVALVALAYIEYLSSSDQQLSAERTAEYRERLGPYLKKLVTGLNPDGLWFGNYDPATCVPGGAPSPYSDGEALLALTKAAKYLGRNDLAPLVLRAAEAGYRLNVREALAADRDSDVTKGYYQWSSMVFYELATSGWPNCEHFGDYLLELADWQIDVHETLSRLRNTAYAYEGLIPAFDLARRRSDSSRVAKYGCVIDIGLQRLISWQVGGPISTRFTGAVEPGDRLAIGGVQNEARSSALRIDVTQHQTHAILFARDLVYSAPGPAPH